MGDRADSGITYSESGKQFLNIYETKRFHIEMGSIPGICFDCLLGVMVYTANVFTSKGEDNTINLTICGYYI